MADDGPDVKNQKKSAKHDSGAADLERVTDYAEEKEISSDITGAVATIGERRRKEAQEKMEREIELAKVPIRKDDVELIGAVDTAVVAEAVLQWLTDNKIHHTVFARTVLGWNSAFTPLLRKPVAWADGDQRTRKAYQEMLSWLQRPHQERLDMVRDKQNQMNRKRRTESTHKDQRRRRPDAPAAPPALAAAGLAGEPLPGFDMAVAGHGFTGDAASLPAGYSEDEFSQPEMVPAQQYTAQSELVPGQQYAAQPELVPGPQYTGQSELVAGQQYTAQPELAVAGAVAPPSYHDSVQQQQQQQQQLGGFQERPPPLYNAPLPGYEELSRVYGAGPLDGPPAAAAQLGGQQLTFAPHLTPSEPPPPQQQADLQEPLSPPELLQPRDSRPVRTQISPLQRRALIDIFHVTARPSSATRQLIASTLDLPQRIVTNFFSAARTRGIRKQVPPAQHGKEQPMVDARP